MKGLLLKDWYMMKKYCRAYLFLAVIFTAASLFSADNLFFVFYPCLLCCMIPINLLSYDEHSHWLQYSGTMPYTKAQLVSSKYLIGLLTLLAVLFVTGAAQAAKMLLAGHFDLGSFAALMLLLLSTAALSSSIALPFIFKLGVEKGRIVYYVMIGFACGISSIASGLFKKIPTAELRFSLFLGLLAVVSIGIYIFSWYLSVHFFRKRELS